MKIKEILMRENDFGILYQELEMIPISLVENEIEENSIILNMCSSLVNKTIQVLEIMKEKEERKIFFKRNNYCKRFKFI